jgi:hypothetical protein
MKEKSVQIRRENGKGGGFMGVGRVDFGEGNDSFYPSGHGALHSEALKT